MLRSLDLLEQHILKDKHKFVYFFTNINHYLIPLNILVVLIGLYFGFKRGYFDNDLYFEIFIYLCGALVIQVSFILKENKLYKDLRSPIFKAVGELIKYVQERRKMGDLKVFVVRGLEFNNNENKDVSSF